MGGGEIKIVGQAFLKNHSCKFVYKAPRLPKSKWDEAKPGSNILLLAPLCVKLHAHAFGQLADTS